MPNRWNKVARKTPNNDRQVLALVGRYVYLATFQDSQWWLTPTIGLGGVSKWMEIPGEPKDFTYWLNRLREWWERSKQNMQDVSDWTTGWIPKNAQLSKKPVFFFDSKTGEITNGLPEHMGAPRGYQKIVCTSAYEAERWSARQRQWDKGKHGKIQDERMAIEQSMHAELRSETLHKLANARNNVNREFLIRSIENIDKQRDKWKYERESHLHSEAHEIKR